MQFDGISKYVMKRTHFKARQAAGIPGFTEADFPDVRQDLLLDVLEQLPKHDGKRAGMKTFASCLIDHRVSQLVRYREAECRDWRREDTSLDDWVHDEDGNWVRRCETKTGEEVETARHHQWRSDEEQADLVRDTADVLARLPAELREVGLRLQTQTVAQIAREMGLSRTTVYERITELWGHFLAAGMKDYL